MNLIRIQINQDHGGDEWINAARAKYPNIAQSLKEHGCAIIDEIMWPLLVDLPGFGDGEYLPVALIDCGDYPPVAR